MWAFSTNTGDQVDLSEFKASVASTCPGFQTARAKLRDCLIKQQQKD